MIEKMVSVEQLDEGMLITADVYNLNGAIIVPENTVVTAEVLNLLARYSIMEVIIGEEIENKQGSFEEIFHAAEIDLEKKLMKILNKESVDVYALLDIVDSIAAKADNDVNLCDMLFKMKRESADLYAHSITVSIYAQLLAKWMDLPEDETELAGIAGLLHDIGLLVCHKEGEKNITLHGEYENKCGCNHMVHGYNLLKDLDVDMRLKQAVLTHHERMDLSGFPSQLSYKSLNYISRLVALADAYDTLTMKEEGFTAIPSLAALSYLYDNCYIKFDTEMLICFIEHLVHNFIQYEVLLSDGQRGKIVMSNKKDPARPLIMVDGGFVDLSLRKDLTITEMYY